MEWLDTISVHDFTGVQAKRQWEEQQSARRDKQKQIEHKRNN